tara:strand:+ start:197 stop:721 length:525 start_codon:yes stop_codon:yes gene_type:complete
MTSKLKTDVLETVSGSGTIALTNQLSGMTSASMPSGSVIQVVSSQFTLGVISTSSTSYVSTGVGLSITPTSSTSKILVRVTGGRAQNPYVSQRMTNTIYRNGTVDLANDSTGLENIGGGLNTLVVVPHSMEAEDSPATTSSVNYTCYFKSGTGQPNLYFSQPSNITITLMEIKG